MSFKEKHADLMCKLDVLIADIGKNLKLIQEILRKKHVTRNSDK